MDRTQLEQAVLVPHSIRVNLKGSEDGVRARLDALLDVLHGFALFVDATPRGAALMAGNVKGLFDEDRWSALCKRMKRGSTRGLCIDRNTFSLSLFSAMHLPGLTTVHCWFSLGDPVSGTNINIGFKAAGDDAVSAESFRDWIDRIEAVSGMKRTSDRQIDEAPQPSTIDFDDADAESAESDAQRMMESISLPLVEVDGVTISGWDSVGAEMELAIAGTTVMSSRECKSIERVAREWVNWGSDAGFGGGRFHGWIEGIWEDGAYRVDVDSGSQFIDWPGAINDLAARVAQVQSEFGSQLSIRLGNTTR